AVTDGRLKLTPEVRKHLDLCLDCRACETACPSGVQYGRLIEPFRSGMLTATDEPNAANDWFHRWVLYGVFPYPRRMSKLLMPVRFAQRTGLWWLVEKLRLTKLLPARLAQLPAMLPAPKRRGRRLPEILPAVGKPRARVA